MMLNRMLAALLAISAPQTTDDSWLQYAGNQRDFSVATPLKAPTAFTELWRQPLGPGTSGVVCANKMLFTMYSVPDKASKERGEEVVTAHDADTGKLIWEHRTVIARLTKQESFSGDPIRPQATPAFHQGKLCTVGYTGLVHCFDAKTGQVVWKYDLVKDFDAKPVQFGFSASPLIFQDSFVLHVGGRQASLLRLDTTTGKVLWKADPGEPSYASPVLATFFNEVHIVLSTGEHILGIDSVTGQTRWKYAMPTPGLTNVPSSMPLPANQLLVSGQGIGGTRLLQIQKQSNTYSTKELWFNSKTQFFYCNFHVMDGMIVGNANKILTALQLRDGKELWRERGYAESNQVRVGNRFIVLAGDGKLVCCQFNKQGLEKFTDLTISKSRCWTAPSLADNRLYVRDQAELIAIELRAMR